jgi:hypothetical protein
MMKIPWQALAVRPSRSKLGASKGAAGFSRALTLQSRQVTHSISASPKNMGSGGEEADRISKGNCTSAASMRASNRHGSIAALERERFGLGT